MIIICIVDRHDRSSVMDVHKPKDRFLFIDQRNRWKYFATMQVCNLPENIVDTFCLHNLDLNYMKRTNVIQSTRPWVQFQTTQAHVQVVWWGSKAPISWSDYIDETLPCHKSVDEEENLHIFFFEVERCREGEYLIFSLSAVFNVGMNCRTYLI